MGPGDGPIIEFRAVAKIFSPLNPVRALEDISFSVAPRQFVSVIGPSGCGKSTLLRMLAGIVYPTEGEVVFDGQPVRNLNRRAGFVTQESNLFPWMTVRENVEFPLVARGIAGDDRCRQALDLLQLVGLNGFDDRYPAELSGGMQKRVSIARTLIYGPSVVLMDEPFGPLDAQTRLLLQNELLGIWAAREMTVLFITHDLFEAIALSDLIVVMTRRPGRVKGLVPVPLTRPRDVFEIHTQKGFAETYHRVWELVRSELDAPRPGG